MVPCSHFSLERARQPLLPARERGGVQLRRGMVDSLNVRPRRLYSDPDLPGTGLGPLLHFFQLGNYRVRASFSSFFALARLGSQGSRSFSNSTRPLTFLLLHSFVFFLQHPSTSSPPTHSHHQHHHHLLLTCHPNPSRNSNPPSVPNSSRRFAADQ